MTTPTPPPPPPPSPTPPPAGLPDPTGYPAATTFTLPDRVGRWRPLLHWLLAIPHLVVLYVLGIVAFVLVVIVWFTGVFAGKAPRSLLGAITMYLRYGNRVATYVLFLRNDYPPFDFDDSLEDGGRDANTRFAVEAATEGRSRLTIFFRGLLVIPHLVVLFFLALAMYVVMVIGFFAVIVLGRWPSGLRSFLLGFLRWSNRLNAYYYLLTDDYPPFSLS